MQVGIIGQKIAGLGELKVAELSGGASLRCEGGSQEAKKVRR